MNETIIKQIGSLIRMLNNQIPQNILNSLKIHKRPLKIIIHVYIFI